MYEQVIIVGSGKFAFQCAMRIKQVHQKVFVFEYKASGLSVLERLCNKNNIDYLLLNKKQMKEELVKQSSKKTLIISAFNTYLFPAEVVNKENLTIVNYHNAYLPFHRGRNAEAWAIYEEDTFSGVTWHLVDTGVDTGKIIIQKKIHIDETVTALGLMQKQNILAYELFDEIVDNLVQGNIGVKNVVSDICEELHYSWDVPNDGELNLNWSVKKISCFLRAMDYGVLNILGNSKVLWNEVMYQITSYKIEACEGEEALYMKSSNLYVIKEGNKITLQVAEMKEL